MTTILTSVKFLHSFQKFTGFSPYRLVFEEDQIRVVTKWTHLIPTLFNALVLGFFFTNSLIFENEVHKFNTKFIFMAKLLLFRLNVFLLMVSMCLIYIRREDMVAVVNKIRMFDKQIEQISGSVDTNAEFFTLRFLIFASTFVFGCLDIISYFILRDYMHHSSTLPSISLVVIYYSGFGLMNTRFLMINMALLRRFRVLNSVFV